MSDTSGTKKQLMKSAGLVGGTQMITILIGIVRTKTLAILLGPAGIGISGFLTSVVDIVRTLTGFGINYSGVKEIASANGTGNSSEISKTIKTLRIWSVFTGILGTLITIAIAFPISYYFFGNNEKASSLIVVSIVLLLSSISSGQIALLQGLKEIKQMALSSLLGAILGTLVVIPIYWKMGISGIVPAFIASALLQLIISWLFAKKHKTESVSLPLKEAFTRGLGMAKLGSFIVLSGLGTMLTIFLVRKIIVQNSGVEGLGNFQAVWTITNMYMGLILNAMLADFLPTLSAVHTDNEKVNSITNTQLEIALLAGGALIALMISLSHVVISLLYSDKFIYAADLLRWQIFGDFFVCISWPIGVIYLAKGKGQYAVFNDLLWCLLYITTVYFGWGHFGFNILGIAYVLTVIIKTVLTFLLSRKLTKFSISPKNMRHITLLGVACATLLFSDKISSDVLQIIVLTSITLLVVIYSGKSLNAFSNIRNRFAK